MVYRLLRINVGGTNNIINACARHGCPSLVYVSSYNVVFNGCTIVEGREDQLPVLDDKDHVDTCASKSEGACIKCLSLAHSLCATFATTHSHPLFVVPSLVRLANQGSG